MSGALRFTFTLPSPEGRYIPPRVDGSMQAVAMDDLFPFPRIRPGQDRFLEDARKALLEGKHLLANAPTGIGKTAVALTAALELARQEGKLVVFLTSKQSQHHVAIETLRLMGAGRPILVADVISKRAMCAQPEARRLTGGFYEFCGAMVRNQRCDYHSAESSSVVGLLLKDILHVSDSTRLSRRMGVCPHKVALEAAAKGEVLVCDYNYIFSDMREGILARLKRSLGELILIVDEGHNLPGRIRSHLSLDLSLTDLQRAVKEVKGRDRRLHRVLAAILKRFPHLFNGIHREEEAGTLGFLRAVDEALDSAGDGSWTRERLVEAVRTAGLRLAEAGQPTSLMRLAGFLERWPEGGPSILRIMDGSRVPKLSYRSLDPAVVSQEVFEGVHGSLVMSGTLHPGEMYADLLGIPEERRVVRSYRSPFPRENRPVLLMSGLTTKYTERGRATYQAYARAIGRVAEAVRGNAAAFFPSYEFLENVHEQLRLERLSKRLLRERRAMSKGEKEDLVVTLRRRVDNGGALLLAVQGGSLSEGVDYCGNILSASMVVGIPLSPPSVEVEALKRYYSGKFGPERGYDYAYLFPAVNKVLQAAGRPIRSEEDRAVVVLMDSRFLLPAYARCLPDDFSPRLVEDPAWEAQAFFSGPR
jgi:DNA excision repair protein ERCC-2